MGSLSAPLISLLHPTARVRPSDLFPRAWYAACEQYFQTCDHPGNVEYIISVHDSRWLKFWEIGRFEGWISPTGSDIPVELAGSIQAMLRCGHLCKVVRNTDRDCVVDQINTAAAHSQGLLIVGVMDDLRAPEHWDTLLLNTLKPTGHTAAVRADQPGATEYLEQEAIIVCGSGATRERDLELMICGATTRKRYERYGWGLDPDFESMYSDNWFVHCARRDEAAGLVKIYERLDIQFDHQHPSLTGGPGDEIYALQNREQAYNDGLITLKRKMGVKVLAVGLPGQTFSGYYLFAWTKLYGHLMTVRNLLTDVYQIYTSNVHCTRIDFTKQVLEARHKADYVFSIDDDNTLTPEQFDMLYQDLEDNPELAGVVGWCSCDPADALGERDHVPAGGVPVDCASCGMQKGWNPDRTEKLKANGEPEGILAKSFTVGDFSDFFQRGVQEGKRSPHLVGSDDIFPHAFWSGLPVILMRFDALKRLGPEAFLPMVRPDVKFGFTSEDTTFFYHAHQLGLKFAVDMRVKVPHLKLRAVEFQYLPGVGRQEVLEAQGKTLGTPVMAGE